MYISASFSFSSNRRTGTARVPLEQNFWELNLNLYNEAYMYFTTLLGAATVTSEVRALKHPCGNLVIFPEVHGSY